MQSHGLGMTPVSIDQLRATLTLSCPGTHLVHVLAVAIHISPNNGPIEMILIGKLIYYVLTIHFACSIIKIGPLVA
jgi:hypothetical protein